MATKGRITIVPPGKKFCGRCQLFKPLQEFYGTSSNYCKSCTRAYQKSANKKPYRVELEELLEQAYEVYGDRCAECGEGRKNLLVLDPFEKSGLFATLKYLRARSFPEGYRFLCLNCRQDLKDKIENTE